MVYTCIYFVYMYKGRTILETNKKWSILVYTCLYDVTKIDQILKPISFTEIRKKFLNSSIFYIWKIPSL